MRQLTRKLRQGLATRLDDAIDHLLARLMRRRLYRLSARPPVAVTPKPSSWNPKIFDAQEDMIRRYAPGRSFADIGCLWAVDGACAFLAEEAGATTVTAMDMWPPTDAYRAEERARGSSVRFVQANLHGDAVVERVGVHDVVWCSGLLYHTPDPVAAVSQLLRLTGSYLIVGTKCLPSVPGLPGAAVYYPGLDSEQRKAFAPIADTVADEPYERDRNFANWFWGLAPETLLGIARSIADVELVEEHRLPWRWRYDSVYLVLQPQHGAGPR